MIFIPIIFLIFVAKQLNGQKYKYERQFPKYAQCINNGLESQESLQSLSFGNESRPAIGAP